MAIKSTKRSRVNQFLIILTGSVILIGSVLIFMYILRGVYGRFQAKELLPDSKVLENVLLGGKPSVGVLYSKYTENMLPEGSTWLNDNITTWEKFLNNSKLKYDVINDQTIELGKHFSYDIIVLPGSRSMSDKEIIQLKKYLNKGGSVFATSGTASYSNDGKWRGWEFFSEVFGLKFSKEIERDEVTKIHTLRGGLPITANIPTGFPLKIATWDRPMSAEVLDPRTTQASFWYNYRLENGLVREQVKKSAGICYGSYGKGRFVWMGFEINSVIGAQEDYIYFDRLFNNCLNWLNYNPIAYVRDWPSNYDAAAVITPIVSEEAENIKNLLPILKKSKVDASFFVNPNEAQQNKNLIKSLTGYGTVGSLVDVGYLSSVNDTINSLNDYDLQLEKLKSSKSILESITHKPVLGAIPYYGLFDQNTVQALVAAKYKYIITDSLTDRSVPNTMVRGDSIIVGMTKTARDDYEVIRDFGLTVPDYQFYTYQEDVDRVLFEGGMYIMKLHTEYQCKKDNVEVVHNIIKDLKKKNFWITTAYDIEKWWSKKSYVEVKTIKRGDTRIAVTVSNPGKETVDRLVIQLDLNDKAVNVSLSAEIIGTKEARFEFDKEKNVVLVYINDLTPSESRTYYIDYYKPNA